MSRQTIQTDKAPAAVGTYSQAVKVGNTVYISGQLGFDPDTMELKEGFEAQAKQVFENIKAICAAAGGTINDVVKFNVSLTDLSDFAALNEVGSSFDTIESFFSDSILFSVSQSAWFKRAKRSICSTKITSPLWASSISCISFGRAKIAPDSFST